MSRTALLVLFALCACGAWAGGPQGESAPVDAHDSPEPPRLFPEKEAHPFSGEKLRSSNVSTEAADMNKNISIADNETVTVRHPKVKDPGTTHEEGRSEGHSSVQACALPDPEGTSSASDWLADSGHTSKLANLCKLPADLLNSTTGTLRVCSIPKDVWTSAWNSAGDNFTSGTVPKELLAKLNATNVTCVTPRSNSSAEGNDTIVTGSIPSAWLLGSNDTIYIYIIPREWLLRKKVVPGKASEVEDLTSDPVLELQPTDAPASAPGLATSAESAAAPSVASTVTPSFAPGSPLPSADVTTLTPAGASPTPTASNATDASGTAIPSTVAASSPTHLANDTNSFSQQTSPTASPITEVPSEVSKKIPTKKPKDAVKSTDRPREETTKPPVRSKEATKPFDKSVEILTTARTENPTLKTTNVPRITITEKSIDVTAKPTEHTDAENDIAHIGFAAPSPAPLSQSGSDHDQGANAEKSGFLQPTESAAILAGVFVAIAVLGYAGLLLWRRVLEKRYGNREMLVNEDDDFDTSDMRHFEL